MPRASSKNLAETDLYRPIHLYLVSRGYTVRSEVNNCDITATKGDELIIIELKRSMSTALLIQATRRQRITDSVYVALPRPKLRRTWKGIAHLLRRLELGLILLSVESKEPTVEIVFHPIPSQRQKRSQAKRAVLQEMAGRSDDLNEGGSCRRKIVTAYRENVIHIACCLERLGPLSPRQLRALGTGPKTASILYSNFYGWFERVDRGVYALRQRRRNELAQYPELLQRYRALVRKQDRL